MSVDLAEINYLAVLVAALVAFVLGGVWYGPLFGKTWVKANGWSEEQVAKIKAEMSPAKFFGGMIIAYLVLAFVIAVLQRGFNVSEVSTGIAMGVLLWLGPAAAIGLSDHLASNRRVGAYLIDTAYKLVYLVLMGGLLAWWR
jgi:hypothetical protein